MNSKNMAVHFSSATDLWATPQSFFDFYNEKFSFSLDVCANKDNAKTERFFDIEQNGLAQEWTGACWMNPPYGRGINAWVKKAYESAKSGATVVCLLPARTDTAWWHDYCVNGDIEFIRGRLKFGGHKNSAPFPSAIVVFRPAPAIAAPVEAERWQPIETAPKGKNGISFMMLAYGPEDDQSVSIGVYIDGSFYAASIFYCLGKTEKPFEIRENKVTPTHWMPIPDTPIDAAIATGDKHE